MRTVFLGSYGFGNLGDELCLLQALEQFSTTEPYIFSVAPEFTARYVPKSNWLTKRAELQEIKPERIVLGGGGVGFWPSLRDALHWMDDAMALGAQAHIHNIGVGKITAPEWFSDPVVRRVIGGLSSFTVRDHVSRWLVQEWGFGRDPGLTFYPEKNLPLDASLAEALLPAESKLLGISVTGQADMRTALLANQDRVRRQLERFKGWKVVPIVSTVHVTDSEEDDIAGFRLFERLFLRDFEVICPELLDKAFWAKELTPTRLKGLIARLGMLISQRKHNCIHAIGVGAPFIGLYPAKDDSIARIVFSLGAELPADTGMLALPVR